MNRFKLHFQVLFYNFLNSKTFTFLPHVYCDFALEENVHFIEIKRNQLSQFSVGKKTACEEKIKQTIHNQGLTFRLACPKIFIACFISPLSPARCRTIIGAITFFSQRNCHFFIANKLG